MDLEINQMIDDKYLPEGGMKLEMFAELNLDSRAGTRYYYEKLMEAKEEKITFEKWPHWISIELNKLLINEK